MQFILKKLCLLQKVGWLQNWMRFSKKPIILLVFIHINRFVWRVEVASNLLNALNLLNLLNFSLSHKRKIFPTLKPAQRFKPFMPTTHALEYPTRDGKFLPIQVSKAFSYLRLKKYNPYCL